MGGVISGLLGWWFGGTERKICMVGLKSVLRVFLNNLSISLSNPMQVGLDNAGKVTIERLVPPAKGIDPSGLLGAFLVLYAIWLSVRILDKIV